MDDIHLDRLEIFFWIQWCASWGHQRSSCGVKKGHLGSKIGNMAKCTWYAYHSIGNFLLNPMVGISRSSEVTLRGQKRSFWGRKSKMWPNAHDMHTIWLEIFFWIQWYASQGHPRSSGIKKGHFREKMGQCRPNTGIPVVGKGSWKEREVGKF